MDDDSPGHLKVGLQEALIRLEEYLSQEARFHAIFLQNLKNDEKQAIVNQPIPSAHPAVRWHEWDRIRGKFESQCPRHGPRPG